LGLTSKPISLKFSEDIIFKGLTMQGISGRRMYQTWYQMTALLKSGKLDLHPAITDRMSMTDFSKGMERLTTGEASKILLYPNGAKRSICNSGWWRPSVARTSYELLPTHRLRGGLTNPAAPRLDGASIHSCARFMFSAGLALLTPHRSAWRSPRNREGSIKLSPVMPTSTPTSTNPLSFITDQLIHLKAKGTHFRLRVLEDEQAPGCTFDGKQVINLASNNYLGLTTHAKLRAAAMEATRRYGVGSGAVRTIPGTMKIHMQLEEQIACFKNAEACVVFQSGFAANAGTVSAILGKDDFIISDELNHASIIDGARL